MRRHLKKRSTGGTTQYLETIENDYIRLESTRGYQTLRERIRLLEGTGACGRPFGTISEH